MATRNYVPRANGEGSIGTEKKHWGGAFFDKLAVKTLEVIGGGTENDAQPATVGWVKAKFQEMLKTAFEAQGVRYDLGTNGYLCLGKLFGGIVIQWGVVRTSSMTDDSQNMVVTPNIAISSEFFSCGNVNIAGGTGIAQWDSVKPVVSTVLGGDKRLKLSSNYLKQGGAYNIRWLLIGV
ncbi:hypothetical protein [Selenomonas sp.]|uniref:hypothetical protein n=1 Tax=Selenomonas sp. TaxID=2053611 RepID=UPI003FA1F0A9